MHDEIATAEMDLLPLRVAAPRGGYDVEGESRGDAADPPEQWLEVLVDSPATQGLFTYRVPPELEVQPGDILNVPFGKQHLGAIAIRYVAQLPAELTKDKVKDVEEIVVAGFFSPHYWQLLERVADYYYTPLIQVIKTALPPGLLARSQRRIRLSGERPPEAESFLSTPARQILDLLRGSKSGDYTVKYIRRQVRRADAGLRELSKRGWVESYLESPKAPRAKTKQAVTLVGPSFPLDLTKRQQEVLQVLRRRGGELWLTELVQICQTSSSVVKKLAEKGCVEIYDREELRAFAQPAQTPDIPKALTSAQANALEVINQIQGYGRVLLHGVTGSGKTEVYLQAIAPILERGKSAIVLVPEIGLTPQLCDRFRARFGDRVAVYHSGLSDGERYDTWRQMLAGTPQIVIGTRSAIFAPLPNLGAIVLDEEYDGSYKQDRPAPTYHARTVAQWRAELSDCPLILGSATPSLETWVDIAEASDNPGDDRPLTYYLSLPERIHARPMPPVEVVDMRQELRKGNRSIFSEVLQRELHTLGETDRQGILFIHRRGHSTFVSCRSCGYVMECPHCDVSLSYHKVHEDAADFLRCHYCGYTRRPPQRCPECESPYFRHFGSGTQRVMQELGRQFPQLRVIRFDSDTTRAKGAHRALLSRFAQGEADVLLGTQMLTKGLDLPQVTLVGVVAADGLLNMSDFRASERAFQMLTQVAGRAGRGDDPGRAIVQTYSPEHPVIQAMQGHDYGRFIEMELEQREALSYPPYGRLVLLRISGGDDWMVEDIAIAIASALGGQDAHLTRGYELLGPAPAPVLRVADRYRWQILLKFPPGESVQLPPVEALRSLCPQEISLAIDVDPLNLN
ncbi:primosomal protein N' [Phormidium sp. CCY1219]|uniref:primosomal protein N' n=1 Tax=Phormidium sp. CCY1219 TaxID=2886104 RepID=UPI002D1F2A08|nr:primosomal protein N' [Phormidium sp. CCY1219]MEB3826668.1 primosomal protein N' [Phormidium sp. CCY1219]